MVFSHVVTLKGAAVPPIFIINRRMAYTFFPKTAAEIKTTLSKTDKKVDQIMDVFAWLKAKYPAVETPINIDPSKLGLINVTRQLEGDVDLAAIKRYANLTSVKLKFGSGSSGNRGVNNRGNLFEPQFAKALEEWWSGVKITDAKMLAALEDLKKVYDLTRFKSLRVVQEGALNKKRPLVYTPEVIITAPGGGADGNIGSIVTDLTLYGTTPAGKEELVAYLSLKLGNTATFFNVGIKTVLTTDEIKSGLIENASGKKLLDLFNIKAPLFCDVFNGNLKQGVVENVWATMKPQQKDALEKLLASGIGHGYHVLHKMTREIKSIVIDKKYMAAAAQPTSCTVYYGGKTGLGKRVDIEIQTKKYVLKLNMRDTQGAGGYPTRLMGDFTYL
jgi:hypothetical protein